MYTIFTCDDWKSHSSMKLISVATTDRELKKLICKLFRNDYCSYKGYTLAQAKKDNKVLKIVSDIKNSSYKDLNSLLENVYIEEIKPNVLDI